MRTIVIVLLLGCFALSAQVSPYESAVLKGKKLLAEADSLAGYQAAFNFFERIASKETSEWLPLYYQAQCLTIMATRLSVPDKKDETLNKALDIVKKAQQKEKNAELVALEGFVQMIRLTVDPATRGQTLSPTIFGLFNEALTLDPNNPRALLFMGQMQYGTAQFFGSGFDEACRYIQKANDIFGAQPEKETISPDWGAKTALAMMKTCNG